MTGLQAAIVSGSALIVIIALLRAALRRHLPARLFPALWCVAAVRLLLPVSIPTRISIWNLFSTRASSPGGMVSETLTAFPALAQTAASAASADHAAKVPVLPIVWLSGALLLGLYFALGYAHSIKTLRAGSLAPSPVEALLLDLFGFANRPIIRASSGRFAKALQRQEDRCCRCATERSVRAYCFLKPDPSTDSTFSSHASSMSRLASTTIPHTSGFQKCTHRQTVSSSFRRQSFRRTCASS